MATDWNRSDIFAMRTAGSKASLRNLAIGFATRKHKMRNNLFALESRSRSRRNWRAGDNDRPRAGYAKHRLGQAHFGGASSSTCGPWNEGSEVILNSFAMFPPKVAWPACFKLALEFGARGRHSLRLGSNPSLMVLAIQEVLL